MLAALRLRRDTGNLLVHAIERAGDFVGNVIDFEVADHLFNLRQRTAIASGYSLTQRHGLSNHLQVRTAGTAVLRRLRFCAALRTVHKDSKRVDG